MPLLQQHPLVLHGIRLPNGQSACVRCQEGKIVEIAPQLTAAADEDLLEGRGWLLLPGAIDMHVHFRTPGGEHKETLVSGGNAAVKGGVTTCADMPNTSPSTTTSANLDEKVTLGKDAPCHMLYNFGSSEDNLAEVKQVVDRPEIRALKIYMGPSTGETALSLEAVREHMRQAGELQLPVMVHAEDLETIQACESGFPPHVSHHHQLRPARAELRAVRLALMWAREFGVKLYLAHTTCAEPLDWITSLKMEKQVMIEFCPHHLLFNEEDIPAPLPNRFKVNPPLRERFLQQELLGILSRCHGCLGSDHAPHTLQEKGLPYYLAPSGMPGVEYLFAHAINWWQQGWFDIHRLIELTSGNAARYFNLNKGSLTIGADADLVLIDPQWQWRIGQGDDEIYSLCGWTPYENMGMKGGLMASIVSGVLRWVHPRLQRE